MCVQCCMYVHAGPAYSQSTVFVGPLYSVTGELSFLCGRQVPWYPVSKVEAALVFSDKPMYRMYKLGSRTVKMSIAGEESVHFRYTAMDVVKHLGNWVCRIALHTQCTVFQFNENIHVDCAPYLGKL